MDANIASNRRAIWQAYRDAANRLADFRAAYLVLRDAMVTQIAYLQSPEIVELAGTEGYEWVRLDAKDAYVVHPVPRDFSAVFELLYAVSADPANYGLRDRIAARGEKCLDYFDQLRRFTTDLDDLPLPHQRWFDDIRAGSSRAGLAAAAAGPWQLALPSRRPGSA